MKRYSLFLVCFALIVSTSVFAANDMKWTSSIKFVGDKVAGRLYTVSAEFTYEGSSPVKGCVTSSFNTSTKTQCSEFVPSRTYQYITQRNTENGKNDIYFELIFPTGSADSNPSNNKITYSFNSSNPPQNTGTVMIVQPDFQFVEVKPMVVKDAFTFLNNTDKDISVQVSGVKKVIDNWEVEFYITSNGPDCYSYPAARIKHFAFGPGTSNSTHEFGIFGITIPELCKGEKQKVSLIVPYPGISVIQVNPDYTLPESDYNNNTVSVINK